MKKLYFVYFILVLAVLQGCNGDVKNDEQTTAVKDTTKIAVPMDRDDAQFAIQVANGNMAEVELGKLAIKKGLDKRVKNLGAMMVKDHIKADAKLQTIAKNKKITLPATVDSADEKNMNELAQNSGAEFDKAFMNYVIKGHEAEIKFLQTSSTQLMDADLRQYAARTLLIYKRHLDAINGIKGSMK